MCQRDNGLEVRSIPGDNAQVSNLGKNPGHHSGTCDTCGPRRLSVFGKPIKKLAPGIAGNGQEAVSLLRIRARRISERAGSF